MVPRGSSSWCPVSQGPHQGHLCLSRGGQGAQSRTKSCSHPRPVCKIHRLTHRPEQHHSAQDTGFPGWWLQVHFYGSPKFTGGENPMRRVEQATGLRVLAWLPPVQPSPGNSALASWSINPRPKPPTCPIKIEKLQREKKKKTTNLFSRCLLITLTVS